jgi:hypothetical protein
MIISRNVTGRHVAFYDLFARDSMCESQKSRPWENYGRRKRGKTKGQQLIAKDMDGSTKGIQTGMTLIAAASM